MNNEWIFGYGSLIWSPGFPYIEKHQAYITGWARRFWQGSHDHRGTPGSPGRVVTLIKLSHEKCVGIAYRVDSKAQIATFENLDHREKNGYSQLTTPLHLADGRIVTGVTYMADKYNVAFLGDAPNDVMSEQIASASGPSGNNADYLFKLANALRSIGVDDPHVFELARQVRLLQTSD